jgi:hypothetical protein
VLEPRFAEVRVHVHEAGREDEAFTVEDDRTLRGDVADTGDPCSLYENVANVIEPRHRIDDAAASEQQALTHGFPFLRPIHRFLRA